MTRNGKSVPGQNGLKVRPSGNKKDAAPFLAAARLKMPGPLTAIIEAQSNSSGRFGIAWREQGQSDFPGEQVVWIDHESSPKMVSHELKIPTRQTVIHVRLLLPGGGAEIGQIAFFGEHQKPIRRWSFRDR